MEHLVNNAWDLVRVYLLSGDAMSFVVCCSYCRREIASWTIAGKDTFCSVCLDRKRHNKSLIVLELLHGPCRWKGDNSVFRTDR